MKHFLEDDPKQMVTISYVPGGNCIGFGTSDTRPWRAILATPLKSKQGWYANTLAELLDAIEQDLP
jgi:hypothetical protein